MKDMRAVLMPVAWGPARLVVASLQISSTPGMGRWDGDVVQLNICRELQETWRTCDLLPAPLHAVVEHLEELCEKLCSGSAMGNARYVSGPQAGGLSKDLLFELRGDGYRDRPSLRVSWSIHEGQESGADASGLWPCEACLGSLDLISLACPELELCQALRAYQPAEQSACCQADPCTCSVARVYSAEALDDLPDELVRSILESSPMRNSHHCVDADRFQLAGNLCDTPLKVSQHSTPLKVSLCRTALMHVC
jgi:hypothetical protein